MLILFKESHHRALEPSDSESAIRDDLLQTAMFLINHYQKKSASGRPDPSISYADRVARIIWPLSESCDNIEYRRELGRQLFRHYRRGSITEAGLLTVPRSADFSNIAATVDIIKGEADDKRTAFGDSVRRILREWQLNSSSTLRNVDDSSDPDYEIERDGIPTAESPVIEDLPIPAEL
ncbi:hypothetical protein MMC24_000392 [Lignoscripta atroalba]|nr:hypothetical protein [Lignoscripta atroalba]